MVRTRLLAIATAVVFIVGLAGCGSSDGDDADVANDSATASAPCEPVGTDLKAGAVTTVSLQLKEYSFTPSTLDLAPGVVTFAATNAGTQNHEMAMLPGGGDVPLTTAGHPDEAALTAAGAFELEAFGPGLSCEATFDLRPGTYTLFCIVTDPDGQTHYQKGMRGQLTVA
jgi:plastocyanin